MKRIEKKIIHTFSGLNETQVIDMTQMLRSILFDALQNASKKVYDSGADRDLLIQVYNEMMRELKNN